MNQDETKRQWKGGAMIAGSLWWDNDIRERWRADRLVMDRATRVEAPLRYGRVSMSRNETFTMTLDADSPSGTAVVAPLRSFVGSIDDLISEAQALWQAEARAHRHGPIASDWGTVGVLFPPGVSADTLAEGWANHFSESGKAIEPVDEFGLLQFPWPKSLDGSDIDSLDFLLATANKSEGRPIASAEVAGAWNRSGCEEYFFNNITNGIRTAEDLAIWRQLDARFRDIEAYKAAVKTLEAEDSQPN